MEWKTLPSERLQALLEKLTARAREHYGERLVSLVLYGSAARGTMKPFSDIDLLVIVKDLPKGNHERWVEWRKQVVEPAIQDECDRLYREGYYVTVSARLKTPEEASFFHPFYLDMTQEAILLFDRDGFFRKVLERLRRRLQELGSKRVFLPDGSWYWVLKPDIKWGEVFDLDE
jgi:predicted nucleotidyltransferase